MRALTVAAGQALAASKGGEFLSTEWMGNQGLYKWKCAAGHTFEQRYAKVQNRGTWCPECSVRPLRRSLEFVHGLITDVDLQGVCLESEFKGMHVKHKFRCGAGHEWEACPSDIGQGRWCRLCYNARTAERLSKDIKWVQGLAAARGGVCLDAVYLGYGVKRKFRCSEGHEWLAKPGWLSNNHTWCPVCGDTKLSLEDLQAVAASRGGKCLSPVYLGAREKHEWECERGHRWEALTLNVVNNKTWCPRCHVSGAVHEILTFVESLGLKTVVNDRKAIAPLELDVYVPELKFGLEYNGLYWHSEAAGDHTGTDYDPLRHIKKFRACRDAGVALLAVFEDEWVNPAKQDLIKAMLRWRLKKFAGTRLYARDLELRRLTSNSEFKAFFARNHIDGHTLAKYAYGLFHKDALVCCASVRTNHRGETEVARLATDYDYSVAGGASRVIAAILADLPSGQKLTSFSNNRLSSGGIYKTMGFDLVQENPPSYYYTDLRVRLWRYKCKRVNTPEVLAAYPTERLQARGGVFSRMYLGHDEPLYQIHDYGHLKWSKGGTKVVST